MKFLVEHAASRLRCFAVFRALQSVLRSFLFSGQNITLHCATLYRTVHEIWSGTGR
jgi:hypothetical protein